MDNDEYANAEDYSCSSHATCTEANDGFEFLDNDECVEDTNDCHVNGSSTNTALHVSCSEINERDDSPCSSNGSCTNSVGSFACSCNDGFEENGFGCAGIDEFATDIDNCNDNATCENEIGRFTCRCNDGYSGDGVNCDVKILSVDGATNATPGN